MWGSNICSSKANKQCETQLSPTHLAAVNTEALSESSMCIYTNNIHIYIYIFVFCIFCIYSCICSLAVCACFLWFNELINIILTSHQLFNKPNFRHVCVCVGVRMLTSDVFEEEFELRSSTTCCMQSVGAPSRPVWVMSRKWGSCNHVITAFRGKSINRFRLVSVSQWREPNNQPGTRHEAQITQTHMQAAPLSLDISKWRVLRLFKSS